MRAVLLKVADTSIIFPSLTGFEKIILNDNFGQELALTRLNSETLKNKRFKEITNNGLAIGSNIVQVVTPKLTAAQNFTEISKVVPNGLFNAAPITELMKFQNGTVGSAVMENGQIVAQAGFRELNISALGQLNPAAVVGMGMQTMEAISGQYYMHEISSQLSCIDKKLGSHIDFHHDEKAGMLLTIKDRLNAITKKSNIDENDISETRALSVDARKVFYEYRLRVNGIDIEKRTPSVL